VGDVPEGDAAVDRARDSRLAVALLRALERRLRRHVLQCGPTDHVPALRLRSGAGLGAAAGECDRHGDLPLRGGRDDRKRPVADAAGKVRRDRVTIEPRLPPWWWDEAGSDEPAPALAGDVAADVCVVGGGYTGL